ncbi:queuosine 5'-phosphate N-glycosylase/hydrolase-like isoform X2 [Ornithodoros turicata]|uniref:queuosine 5'-phosphate N-glycosylase/hydrolase-like isoform X2 n=1 Tax=Ornithodoros turicata TaxID=34597 RepID=UPI003139D5F6
MDHGLSEGGEVFTTHCAIMEVLGPKDSARLIAESSKDVSISQEGISKVADLVQDGFRAGTFSIHSWKKHHLHPKVADNRAAEWIFLVDSLNFSFWSKDDQWYEVTFEGNKYSGYWSLCAAVNRALQEGTPLLNPEFRRDISREAVEKIFRSDSGVPMPLLEERHRIIRECGKGLCEEHYGTLCKGSGSLTFGGSFTNCITQSSQSCQKLINLLAEHFPSFRDEAVFEGFRVSFYKRAQILVADLWSCFEGENLGRFHDIATLTAFADYRVPQVLAYFGALQYSQHLEEMLAKDLIMENGQREEMEIRGAMLHACELVREELSRRAKDDDVLGSINSVLVDYFLWDYRRKHANDLDHIPFHKVRCIYY